MKITAKFRASKRLRFEATKRISLLEMRPKSLGTFEKRASDLAMSMYWGPGYDATGTCLVYCAIWQQNQ